MKKIRSIDVVAWLVVGLAVVMAVHYYRSAVAGRSAEEAESGGCRGQHGESCRWCAAAVRWREENPDRRDADIVDAAERGMDVTLPDFGED